MCFSPLTIKTNSVYRSRYYTPAFNHVPCGKCLECRNQRQDEWITRLSADVWDLYSRGGIGIFTTLTFNNYYLPSVTFFCDGELHSAPCFDGDYLSKFLADIKTRLWRKFGKSSYRYFGCMEFGKHTKRQHLHIAFLLEPSCSDPESVRYIMSVIRSCWHYGFVFPASNSIEFCKFRSVSGAVNYAAKYICKDLAYYEEPSVNYFIDNFYNNLPSCDFKKKLKRNLAHPFMSKGIGRSILGDGSDKYFISLLRDGFYNPYSQKNEPIPDYIRRKILYKFVRSSRVSSTTGKFLYERNLSSFFRRNSRSVFNILVSHVKDSYSKFFDGLMLSRHYVASQCNRVSMSFRSLLRSFRRVCSVPHFMDYLAAFHVIGSVPSAFYHHYLSFTNEYPLLNINLLYDYFIKKIDITFLKRCDSFISPPVHCLSKLEHSFFYLVEFMDRVISCDRCMTTSYNYDLYLRNQELKRLYLCRYPKSLC